MDVELITPDHHVVSGHDELWQRCILWENTYTLKFSERSSYNATVKQSKIRCINITCNQYKWYDMAIIILCLWSPSPKHRHDHHCHRCDTLISIVASLSSRQLLLLRLLLPLRDKVKQLQGDCIAYNKAITIWLLPVADNSVTKHDAKFYCMRWSCFVTELSATGRSLMVVALLYEMQTPCNCFTLSLSGSDSRRSNSWREDNNATMEIKVLCRWRWWSWRCFGDGYQRHKMIMAISYHLYWLHVMFILYASYFV